MRYSKCMQTVDEYDGLIMLVAMFCRVVGANLLALMHSSVNKEPDTSDYSVIFGGGIVFTQMANNLQIHSYCLW